MKHLTNGDQHLLKKQDGVVIEDDDFFFYTTYIIHETAICPNPPVQKFNLSKPSGFFTYHKVCLSKIVHGARFALCVLYGSQNRHRLLLCTLLTDWFL